MGQGGQDGQADGQEVQIHRVDSGGSGVVHRDGYIHLCDQAPHDVAGQDQEGRGGHVDDGNHQGRVGKGERDVKNLSVMVKNQEGLAENLLNGWYRGEEGLFLTGWSRHFVAKYPNLGLVGGVKKSGESTKIKTASCQLEN